MVLNSVVNGINAKPNQFTGGEGPVTGEEVQINVIFTTSVDLAAGHYFFRPEVLLSIGNNFLWLSAPKPIVPLERRLRPTFRLGSATTTWRRTGSASVPT